jgi:hypothetical protein
MFKDKNDPLLDAAKTAMQKGDERRKAVSSVNEHFGVYSRRALPLAKKAEYDIALKKVLSGDKLVVEEAEQLDEISKKTLGSYIKKAHVAGIDADARADEYLRKYPEQGPGTKSAKWLRKASNRERGINKAADKLVKEDPEQLDEISKKTLGSYIKKATDDVANHAAKTEVSWSQRRDTDSMNHFKKRQSRGRGIDKAVDKLVKEDPEQLDELSRKALGNYVFKAGGEVMDRANKRQDDPKLDKRLSGMDKASTKIKRKTLEGAIKAAGASTGKLEEKVLANKTDDYSPSYQKSDEKAERRKRLMAKAKDKKQLDEASKKLLQNYVQKAVASQIGMVTKRKAVGKDEELEKDIRKRGRGINNAKDKLEGPRGANRSYQTAPDGKMKPTKVFASLKEEVVEEDHEKGKEIVQNKDTFKRLLKSGKMVPRNKKIEKPVKVVAEDVQTIKEEIANALYEKYQAVNEDEKQAWVDALNEEEFGILYEFYNPNINFRQTNANPFSAIHGGLKSVLATGGRELKDTSGVTSAVDDAITVGSSVARGVASGVRSLAGRTADLIGRGMGTGTRAGNLNAGKPASGIASFAPKPAATTSAVAAAAAEKSAEKEVAQAPAAPASVAPVAAATAAAAAPPAAVKANRIIANPNLKDVWDNYTPDEKAKRDGMTGLPAIEFDKNVANRLKTTGVPDTPAAAPTTLPSGGNAEPTTFEPAAAASKPEAPDAPAAPEAPAADAPVAQTDAAAAETKSNKGSSSRAPMAPKRSGSWGFGSGSGSDSAGAITNRALGAVNEEFTPRGALDGWINKYAPKKKK